jgi:hypothetical protein
MVQPGPSGFSQIYREELDDEQIIGYPSRSTREAIILQPNTGVSFAIVFGGVARRLKEFWKMSAAHLGTKPFGTEATSLVIVMAPTT